MIEARSRMSLLRLNKAASDVATRRVTKVFTIAARSSSSKYIDDWYCSIVKPAKFYDDNAAPGLKRKNYFYTIDLQGRVFLG
jgi:hypothetical protein